MVRVKYRYIVASVSVSKNSSSKGDPTQTPGYPGCPTLSLNAPSSGISSEGTAGDNDSPIYRALKTVVQQAHGAFGLGRVFARFRIIYWNAQSGLFVVRTLRGLPTEQLTSAMTLLTSIQLGGIETPALIDVLHRSGTVRSCQKFIVKFYRQQIDQRVSGVNETAIARAITRQLIDSNYPHFNLELS